MQNKEDRNEKTIQKEREGGREERGEQRHKERIELWTARKESESEGGRGRDGERGRRNETQASEQIADTRHNQHTLDCASHRQALSRTSGAEIVSVCVCMENVLLNAPAEGAGAGAGGRQWKGRKGREEKRCGSALALICLLVYLYTTI